MIDKIDLTKIADPFVVRESKGGVFKVVSESPDRRHFVIIKDGLTRDVAIKMKNKLRSIWLDFYYETI